jgi:hypothetical protein
MIRGVLATGLGPVLLSGGLALPSAAMTAVAVAGVTAAAVATAPAAQAAAPTGNGKALVLLRNGESTDPEKPILEAAGWSVDQETPATWNTGHWTWNGNPVTFSSFAVLVIGDPSTTGNCSTLRPSTTGTGTGWQLAVTGNVAVAGTAPSQRARPPRARC